MNQFNLLSVFKYDFTAGFALLETETYNNELDETDSRSLFGIAYDKEDKQICIDFLWRMFFISL